MRSTVLPHSGDLGACSTQGPFMVSGGSSYMHFHWHGFLVTVRLPVLRSRYSVRDTTKQRGYPMSDTRSNCVILPSKCATFEHAVQKHPSWFPCATLPQGEAVLWLTHGRNVYIYHVHIPPGSILYRSTNHGFWRLELHALSMAWLQC